MERKGKKGDVHEKEEDGGTNRGKKESERKGMGEASSHISNMLFPPENLKKEGLALND